MTGKLNPQMRALKLLVIALGALLAVGVVGLAAAIIWRVDHVPKPPPAGAAVSRIVLPPGAKVVGSEVAAGRVVVRSELPDGGTRLDVFDLATGAEVSTIELAPPSK
jgi:uncharacterized protein DUF6476